MASGKRFPGGKSTAANSARDTKGKGSFERFYRKEALDGTMCSTKPATSAVKCPLGFPSTTKDLFARKNGNYVLSNSRPFKQAGNCKNTDKERKLW